MKFIATRLETEGFVNRSHLMQEFGISVPQASMDLQTFLRLHPQSMTYSLSRKRYESVTNDMSEAVQIGAPCVLCGRPQVAHGNGECPTSKQIGMSALHKAFREFRNRSNQMTTKVRITNIVEEGNAHSNGDVVVHGLPGDSRKIIAPGESHEIWLEHSDIAKPLVITERWPTQPK